MAKSIPFSLLLVCVVQFAALSRAQSCYTPGGALSTTHFPCYPDAGTSLCCSMGWTCFSSNLCIVTDPSAVDPQLAIGTAQRGGCTNPSGDNDLCGDYCLDADDDSLVPCGSSRFCCGSAAAAGTCNCDTGEGTFAAEGGEAKTIMGQEGLEKTATTVESTATTDATLSTSTATDSSSTTLTTSTTASRTSSTSQTSETASGSTSNSATQSTGTSTATALASSTPFTKKTGFKVLIAIIAVAVAAILLAAIFLFLRRRKTRKEEYEPGPFPDDSSSLLNLGPLPPTQEYTRKEPDYSSSGLPPLSDSPRIGGGPNDPLNTRLSDILDPRPSLEIEPLSPPPPPPPTEPQKFPFPMASIPKPYEGT